MTDDLRQQLIRIDRDHSHLRRRFASDVEVAPAGNEGFRAVKQADDDEVEVKLELSTDPEKGSRSITVTMDPGEDGNAQVHIDKSEGHGHEKSKSKGPRLKHTLVKLLQSRPDLRQDLLPLLLPEFPDLADKVREDGIPPEMPAEGEFQVVPVQTRACFDNELMPQIERLLETMTVEEIQQKLYQLLDLARASRNDLYSLIKHYINADQSDEEFFQALKDTIEEWAQKAYQQDTQAG